MILDILPGIDLPVEDESERETKYLLASVKMKERLLGALNRTSGISLEEIMIILANRDVK